MKNRSHVIEAYETLTVELGRMPTVLEVAAKTGLSKVTVYAHKNDLLAEGQWQEELLVLKMQRGRYLNVLAKAGYKDAKVAKLILDLLNSPFVTVPATSEKNQNSNNTNTSEHI